MNNQKNLCNLRQLIYTKWLIIQANFLPLTSPLHPPLFALTAVGKYGQNASSGVIRIFDSLDRGGGWR